MMPLMKATGTNTARMAKVVAITARPISWVPSRAACMWLLPMLRWRTMFSRTTMASSMSNPMHSDRAIRVMKFRVKPNACSTMKVVITEIGRVRPVMMVERQECRNRNTISTVSSAPSRIVSLTPVNWALSPSEFEYMVSMCTSSGRRLRRSLIASCTPSPTCTILAFCTLKIDKATARLPSTRASEVSSASPSTTSAT